MEKIRSFLMTVATALAAVLMSAGHSAYAEIRSVSSWTEIETAYADTSVEGVSLGNAIQQLPEGNQLTINRTFSIDLNGHDLTLTNRLAEVQTNGFLKLTDSMPANGAAFRGGFSACLRVDMESVYGGLVRGCPGGRVDCRNVTFVDANLTNFGDGGVFYLDECPGYFENCRFLNCRAFSRGGAIYALNLNRDVNYNMSELNVVLVGCSFSGGDAVFGGALALGLGADGMCSNCVFASVHSDYGAVFADSSKSHLAIIDCFFTNNVCGGRILPAIYLWGYGGNCYVTNSLFIGNTNHNGKASLGIETCSEGTRLSVTGGVLDAKPGAVAEDTFYCATDWWVAEGFMSFKQGDYWSVVRTDTLVTNELGQIARGVFAFDPSQPRYAHYLTLDPQMVVTPLESEPGLYEVRLPKVRVGDILYDSYFEDGVAKITNATRVASRAGTGESVIAIPATIANYPVGICSNAFDDFKSEGIVLDFLGNPPAVVEEGAFSAVARGFYSRSCADAWKAAGEYHEGESPSVTWRGLTLTESPYVWSWSGLETAANDTGVSKVKLGCRIDQSAGENPLNLGRTFAIDLNGYGLNVSNRVAIVNGGATLALTNSCPELGGAFSGCCGTWDEGGLFLVNEGGRIEARDVTFADAFSPKGDGGAFCFTGGSATLTDCQFRGCHGSEGGVVKCDNARLEFVSCKFIGNSASRCSVFSGSHSDVRFVSCEILDNNTASAHAINGSYSTFAISGCVIKGNRATGTSYSLASHLSLSLGATCQIADSLFVDNTSVGPASDHSPICTITTDSRMLTFTGGVLDCEPMMNASGGAYQPVGVWAAEGFTPFELGGYWSAAVAGTLVTNQVGQIEGGVFAFDPTARLYDGYFSFAPSTMVCKTQEDPVRYTVYPTKEIDGFIFGYTFVDGDAIIVGIKRTAGSSGDGPCIIPIPGEIDGRPVGFYADALKNFATTGCYLNFQGEPPSVVDPGTFSANVRASYAPAFAEAWKKAGVYHEGWAPSVEWQGLVLTENRFVGSWAELVSAAGDTSASGAALACRISQPTGESALTVSRAFAIDLYGFDLVASNRLSFVEKGGLLKLTDSRPANGAALRGGCPTGQGGIVDVLDEGRIECRDVAFADAFVGESEFSAESESCGAAVAIVGPANSEGLGPNAPSGSFANCRFVNGRAARDAGAVYLRNGRAELVGCTFHGNRAGYGGAVNAGFSKSELTVRSCVFDGNVSKWEGGAVYAAENGTVSLIDCVITNNATLEPSLPAVYVRKDSLCAVTNTLVAGNLAAGSSPCSLTLDKDGGAVSFTGGVIDVKPALEDGRDCTWAAEGFAPFAASGCWSVAYADTLVTNALGQIMRGVFAFDPSQSRYAPYLTVMPQMDVTRLEADFEIYEVAPPAVIVNGILLEYYIADGTAMIVGAKPTGDKEGTSESFIAIPVTIADCPVGIAANAFAAFAGQECCFEFLGLPPKVVEAGAFPADAYGCFLPLHAEAWKAAGQTGEAEGLSYVIWNDLFLIKSPYVRSWDELAAAAADPEIIAVELLASVVKPADGEALTITNAFSISLNGYDVTASNRLAVVRSGGDLTLYDDTSANGGTISGGVPSELGGVVHVTEGGRLSCWGVTFADSFAGGEGFSDTVDNSGGAVSLYAATGTFNSCTFVNCHAQRDGGAIFQRFGRLELCDCLFVGNEAGWGGAVNVGTAENLVKIERCEFVGNRSQGQGGAAYVAETTALALVDCVVTNNAMNASEAPAVYLHGGTSCFVTNSLIVGNLVAGEKALSIATAGTVSFSGGVTDAQPRRFDGEALGWAAEGYVAFEQGGRWTVVADGTLITNRLGQVRAGVFAFDPSNLLYQPYLTLDPDACVTTRATVPATYDVRIVKGGPYATEIDGVTVTYRVLDGKAYLGDGTGAAIGDVTSSRVVLPTTVDGYAVHGISANAFAKLPSSTEFVFLTTPPADVKAGAFPAGAKVRYCLAYEDAWLAETTAGRWNGLTVLEPFCNTWEIVCKALAAGRKVNLACDVTATDAGVTLDGPTCRATLDFCGKTITVSPSLGTALRLGGGAELTLMDSIGGGGFSGGGVARTSDGPVIDIVASEVMHVGGSLRDFRETRPLIRLGELGIYTLDGGSIAQCSASSEKGTGASGFLMSVEGGRLNLEHGGITNCVATGAGLSLVSLSTNSAAALQGGHLLSCAVPQDAHLFDLTDEAWLTFYGTVVADNRSGGTPVGVDANALSGVTVYGGAFDVRPTSVARGFEALSVPSSARSGGFFLVARQSTLAMAKGLLTAGEFAFDPTDRESYGLYLPLPTDDQLKLTKTPGDPTIWSIAVKGRVVCDTLADLRANLLVGNDAVMSEAFGPQAAGKLPSGFVYRAAVVDEKGDSPKSVGVTLRLYSTATGGTALWEGATNVTTGSEGVFQIWVDDRMRSHACVRDLADVFACGEGVYLGVSFAGESECSPRRNLVSVPLVSRTACAAGLDSEATASYLIAATGTVTCADLNLRDGGLCTTLEIAASNAVYNVSEMSVGGFTLYRHADNRILSSKDSDWIDIAVTPGFTFVRRASTSGLLTIKSDDGDTVPLLTVPVPAGGSFIWQSTPFTGKCRWTSFGENN